MVPLPLLSLFVENKDSKKQDNDDHYRPIGPMSHFIPFCLQYIYHNIIQTLKDVTLYNDLNLFIGLNISQSIQ